MPKPAELSGIHNPFRGKKVGKYEVLTRMSVGGMAELFLAFTTGPGGFRKFVALKQILPDVKTEEFVRMFLDEARITAAFSHPNIGQVFDLGEEDEELYLAMEFLAGQNLEQIMTVASREGMSLPIGFAARAVRDVCLGLHYAHHFTAPSGKRVQVVHRDLTPRNVMVTYDGLVKVIDFGIAKAKGRLNRTQVGMVKGTSGYMSPEQVRNQDLDGRSDLFCAGVVLHELLSGTRVYDTSDEDAMMRQIAHSDMPSPRSFNPEVPEALDAVVMRAMCRDPGGRYATGREMAKAIEQAMGSELFDEEAMAELMRSFFADKRQKTLALLDYASADDDRVSEVAIVLEERAPELAAEAAHRKRSSRQESNISDTLPPSTKPSEKTSDERAARPPPPMPRPLGGSPRSARTPTSPSEPAVSVPRPRALSGRVVAEPPSRMPAGVPAEDEATQVSPPEIVKQARAAAEPEAANRRPPRMGMFTLGPVEAPAASQPEEREDSEVSEVSRVSRVSRALAAMERPSRRGLWILLGIVILAGIGVLFMPESLRSRLGSLFSSAGSLVAPNEMPKAEPSTMGIPTEDSETPPPDAYEPPPPGEGSPEPVNAAPAPTKATPTTPAAATPRPRKPESATPTEAAAKPATTPKKPASTPAIQAKPTVPEPEAAEETEGNEAIEEPAERSVGPAEVDPSIQPLELSPPEGEQ
ncbi:MAG TPA: serine/threonine-protein kinase [Myxococcaceae bacterium]|jgi:serine/threonine-protein kinase